MLGSPGIAVGNVVGSNIGNVFLILGLAALLCPIIVDPEALRRDGTVLMVASILCVTVVLLGEVSRIVGAIFVAALLGYVGTVLYLERRKASPAADLYTAEAALISAPSTELWKSVAIAAIGLVITIMAAKYLVAGAIAIAQAAGLSETVIGLTVVAIGTSTPELVTSIIAVRKGQGDVAFGNVIGSNIFNILGILGETALIQPLAVPDEITRLDIWVMIAATLAMLVFARTGWRVGRREGAAMVAAYVIYISILLSGVFT